MALSSLTARPLEDRDVAALNRADAVDLAVAVDDTPASGLLVATDDRVTGLVHDGGWRVVERVSLADADRYDALRACEDAVRSAPTF